MLQQQYDFACLEEDDEEKAASAMVPLLSDLPSLPALGKLGERHRGSWELKRLPHITWVVCYFQCPCLRNRIPPGTPSQDDARDQDHGSGNRSCVPSLLHSCVPALHLQFFHFTCSSSRTCNLWPAQGMSPTNKPALYFFYPSVKICPG